MIKGLRRLLSSIEDWPEINSIIPGRIDRAKEGGKIKLRVNYQTSSGLKAIARGNASIQEVFFVTNQPDDLLKKLKEEGVI